MKIKDITLEHKKEDKISWWEENIVWRVERFWDGITDIPREIKWFWQRGTRGYADCDLWGLDNYLESWLPEALLQFAKETHSYPGYGKAKTYKKWQGILKKMARGFKAVRDEENNFEYKNIEEKAIRDKKAYRLEKRSLRLMTEWFNHLWD